MHSHCSPIGPDMFRTWHEARETFFAVQTLGEYMSEKSDELPAEGVAKLNTEWDMTVDLSDIIAFACKQEKDVTDDNLIDYLETKEKNGGRGKFNTMDKYLYNLLIERVDTADDTERLKIQSSVDVIISFLNHRRRVHAATHKRLEETKNIEIDPGLPEPVNSVWQGTKNVVGSFTDGFKKANGAEKLTMIGGVVAGALLLRAIYKWAQANKEKSTIAAMGVAVTKWGLIVGAGTAAYLAINKAVEKSSGRPLTNVFGGVKEGNAFPFFTSTTEEWNDAKRKQQLHEAWQELSTMDIPTSDFLDFVSGPENQRKYAFALINFLGVKSIDLIELYEKARTSTMQISDAEAPHNPFKKDFLSGTERFLLVKEILETVGFVDETTGEVKEDTIEDNELNVEIGSVALETAP